MPPTAARAMDPPGQRTFSTSVVSVPPVAVAPRAAAVAGVHVVPAVPDPARVVIGGSEPDAGRQPEAEAEAAEAAVPKSGPAPGPAATAPRTTGPATTSPTASGPAATGPATAGPAAAAPCDAAAAPPRTTGEGDARAREAGTAAPTA